MKELINKILTQEDISTIDSITGRSIQKIIDSENLEGYKSNEKHIASKFDIDGLHLLRCILTEKILLHKRSKLTNNNQYAEEFVQNGVVVLPDSKNVEPVLKYALADPNYSWPSYFGEKQGVSPDYDIQYTLHVDSFHPCFKVFRYNHDIKIEHGPYSYVLGSNRNTKEKLTLLYDLSVRRSKNILDKNITREKNHIIWTPSFRIATDKDYCIHSNEINKYLNSYNLPNETPIIGKEGSIIITDVSGLHRKYPTTKGYKRSTGRYVHPRENPFLI